MYYVFRSEPAPIQYLKGVGPLRAKAFQKVGINYDVDLLFYFPRSYVNRSSLLTIKQVCGKLLKEEFFVEESKEYSFKEEITLVVRVLENKIQNPRSRKPFLTILAKDLNDDKLKIFYWNYIDYYYKYFQVGEYYIVNGVPEINAFGELVIHHPEVEKFDTEEQYEFQKGSTLPVYSIPSFFKVAKINNKVLRKLIKSIIEQAVEKVEDFLPSEIVNDLKFKDLQYSLLNIHFPTNPEEIDELFNRFKFQEAFLFELLLGLKRNHFKTMLKAPKFEQKGTLLSQFYKSLKFELTNDQKKVIREIFYDFRSGKPMNRLIQGDVGSGKTIVAVFAMLLAKENCFQSAIMAPTEVLAEQHLLTLQNLLFGFPVTIEIVVGSQSQREREIIERRIKNGEIDIIVGTHALFEGNVLYKNLGLIIIDEQHRFGVEQRHRLRQIASMSLSNNFVPHMLVMSATPIPRTLAMTLYGDLDVSMIKEFPKGRKPVWTRIVYEKDLPKMYDFIREKIKDGRQAFFVYPLIEKSEKLDIKSATEHWELLQKDIFPEYKCGLLHGRMKPHEKEEVMQRFKNKEFSILVATTVIEVGIDVPNATIMVVESAERFGLAQLHQLRGRVGRGSYKSYCFLVTKDRFDTLRGEKLFPESEKRSALVRLKAIESISDGFKIAEIDLKLRGPGDVLGKQQTGFPEFRYLNLATDGEIISKSREYAFSLLKKDPFLKFAPKLSEVLNKFSKGKKYWGIG
ncbi:MAG: ATP-dependent DNA helicase RecG [Ignavibacteria bacterium]|nr:ATP-dependent DNA helicase RecG [Ignavibacteria bacterium]